jgi:hypothetical protein
MEWMLASKSYVLGGKRERLWPNVRGGGDGVSDDNFFVGCGRTRFIFAQAEN